MKLILIIIFLLTAFGIAYAQSTANQIVMGYLTIVNGQAVWQPYTIANPMPASSN